MTTNDILCDICMAPLRKGSYDGYVCSIECSVKRNLARASETARLNGKPFTPNGGYVSLGSTNGVEPYRNPSPPVEYDFAVVVFRTDHRVLKHVKAKWEIVLDANGNPENPDAWRRAMEACYELGKNGHAPEAEWYREAQELSERVGKRWDDTPIPTLVEALARKEGQWPLGFPTTNVPACGHVRICTQPQLPFRGRRLILGTEEIAQKFLVEEIRVGNVSCLLSGCSIPGSVFSDRAFPLWLKLPTAQVSQNIALHLVNMSGASVEVTPMIQGDAIEPNYRPMNLNAIYGKHAYQPKPGERVVYEDSDSVLVENERERR